MDDGFGTTLTIIAVVLAGAAGFGFGFHEGMEAVASGKYECALVADEDLTTSWVCVDPK